MSTGIEEVKQENSNNSTAADPKFASKILAGLSDLNSAQPFLQFEQMCKGKSKKKDPFVADLKYALCIGKDKY